jgi:hypothetical protein
MHKGGFTVSDERLTPLERETEIRGRLQAHFDNEPLGGELTLEHLQGAVKLLKDLPPVLSEIHVADAAELVRWLCATSTDNESSLFGVRVLESEYMPKHTGIMFDSDRKIIGIFDMREEDAAVTQQQA